MGEQQGCEWCKRSEGSPRPEGKPPASCKRAIAPLTVTSAGARKRCACWLGRRRCAAAADIPPEAVGGKLWRIDGATDYLEVLGKAGACVLKVWGRWGSDVAFINARANTRDMLDASAKVGDEWVQPAPFR